MPTEEQPRPDLVPGLLLEVHDAPHQEPYVVVVTLVDTAEVSPGVVGQPLQHRVPSLLEPLQGLLLEGRRVVSRRETLLFPFLLTL